MYPPQKKNTTLITKASTGSIVTGALGLSMTMYAAGTMAERSENCDAQNFSHTWVVVKIRAPFGLPNKRAPMPDTLNCRL